MKKDSLKRLLYLRFVVDFIYCLFLFVFVVVVIAVAVAIVFFVGGGYCGAVAALYSFIVVLQGVSYSNDFLCMIIVLLV